MRVMSVIREKLQRFMIGRYGVDSFSRFLLGVSIAVMLASMIVNSPVLHVIVILLLVYSYFRMFSRNYQKRYAENMLYMKKTAKIRSFLNRKKLHIRQFKTHKFYRCPGCGQDIRVPRGKGRILITCPKCRNEFEKQT